MWWKPGGLVMINHWALLYIMHYTARCMFTKKRLQDWTVQENVNLSPGTQALLWWINYTASRVIIAWQVVDYKEHDRQPDFWAVTLFPWKYMSLSSFVFWFSPQQSRWVGSHCFSTIVCDPHPTADLIKTT